MNVLALCAHPDDVEFFCAGTLLKYKEAGHRIFIALTTSGNIGSNSIASREEVAATREQEQLAAAETLAAEVHFLRYDDQLLTDTPTVRREILNAIRWADPDVILTNYPGDNSTDHAVTSRIVGRVLLSCGSKLIPSDLPPLSKAPSVFYFDTVAGIGFEPEVYVDITAQMPSKLDMLRLHKSQFEWMREFGLEDLCDVCETIARFRGLQTGKRYAEAFRMHRVSGFVADPRLLP